MFTTASRIIKYGLQGFWRNGWLSVATIALMVLVLFSFEGMIIFSVIGKTAINELQDKIDISVYFKPESVEDDILKLEEALESLEEVKSVEYVSKDKALEMFRERHKDETVIATALEELESNPLLASLNIKARDPQQYSIIASYLENDDLKHLVEKVSFAQNRVVIERLARIVDSVKSVGGALIIFLSIVAALVIFNTIRLAIYSNREELNVLRLVGASDRFINGPFIVNGIIYGVIGALLSIVLTLPLVLLTSPYIEAFIPSLNLGDYFVGNILLLLGYQLLFGIVLGVVSSMIAVRRYLKI